MNGVFLQIFMTGAMIHLGAIVAIWTVGYGTDLLLYSRVSRLWVFPATGAAIIFFLAGQYYIHQIMTHSKQRRLAEIDKLLTKTYGDWVEIPSKDKSTAVTELMKWRDRISTESDWPLKIRSVLAIVSGLLSPTIKTMMDLRS